MKIPRHLIICSLLYGTLFQPGLASAMECIVVSSTVEHLSTNTRLSPKTSIDIPTEEKIKVVCEDATSKVIRGPYQGPVDIHASEPAKKLQTMDVVFKVLSLLTRSEETTTTGASRSVLTPKAVGPWTINLQEASQRFCLTPERTPTLWRSDSTWPTTLLIENLRSGDRLKASMAQDDATLFWPKSLPIRDNEIFRISESTGSTNTVLHFTILPENFSGEIELALAMAERGCTRQSRLLITQM